MFFISCFIPSSYDFKSYIFLNLKLKFLKLIYSEAVYRLFLTFPCKTNEVGKKFKHLDGVFGIFSFFRILKLRFLCL